ncbi:sodium/calcium exchanger protein [Phytophthora boehmeriae]|uniref:Sodium/calcium exchanger protein n=1 Tax=Phytophthora boehmeriae TaxID=109152 RepID=A0A8T1X4A3_9STRA|nr:sodium/calcium exchanger protein [Phytophthora boehmeriae]
MEQTLLPAACDAQPFVANMTLGPLSIDYVHLHYCSLAGLPLLSALLLLLWLALLFYFLGSTADGYFSPTLASLSDRLRVPHDVAGVTFLAFGNGAPDVFSAIAAYSSGVGEAGINELLGGAVFVSTVVVGAVAVASSVHVQRWAFVRDVGALLASLLLLMLLTTTSSEEDVGQTAVAALLFLALYGMYVASVVFPACVARYRAAEVEIRDADMLKKTSMMISAFWHALSPRGKDATSRVQRDEQVEHHYTFITRSEAEVQADERSSQSGKTSDNGAGKTCTKLNSNNYEMSSPKMMAGPRFSSRVFDDHFDVVEESLSSPLIADDERTDMDNDDELVIPDWQRHLRWRWRLQRRVVRMISSNEPLVCKLLYIPQALLVLVRDITVPLFDDEAWSRPKASLAPITVPLLVALTSGYADTDISGGKFSYHVPLWQVLLVVGFCLSGIVSFTTHRSHAPRSITSSSVLLTLAFVACVCWIYAVATELMALLVAVGYITRASNSLLGLTVLAWGNSVGDLITDVSVARAGFPQMAIAGCFGGPVFNVLLGLGLPMLYACIRGRSEDLALDIHAWISLAFLFVSLTSSLLVFQRHKYRCPPWYGKLLMIYYFIYSLLNLAVAFRVVIV